MIDDRARLEHIVEAIERIQSYTAKAADTFFTNSMVQDAVIRNIQIIGEAAHAISDDFKNTHREIPWRDIVGTRNIIVHEYFRVDLEIIWDAVNEDLARLKAAVVAHLEQSDDE
jgi:uncharacterized protein with HEPN domain